MTAEPSDSFEFQFEVWVYPHNEPRWFLPLFDEVVSILRDLGSQMSSGSPDFEQLHGRILLRWNGELILGIRVPLSARTTWSAVDEVAKRAGCARQGALQIMAQAAYDQYYAMKLREMVMRTLVAEELGRQGHGQGKG
jgi:hypothetical protein